MASSAIVVMNPMGQFAKTHDAQRKNDLEQIRQALDMYYSDNNSYPADGGTGKIDGKDWGTSWAPYMTKLPKDPSSPSKDYRYESPVSGDAGAYRLYATLERCSDSQTTPGVDCLRPENYSINSSNLATLALIPTPTPTLTPTPTATLTPTPWPVKKVFVTSTTHTGDLKTAGSGSDGLDGANKLCQSKANAGGLTGTYKAWLSSGTISARDRLTHGLSAYKKTDASGTVVANNWSDLTDGQLKSPINFNEKKIKQSGTISVWTNTKTDGSLAGSNSCGDWEKSGASYKSVYGSGEFLSSLWTFRTSSSCNNSYRLYCIEQ